MRTSAGMWPSPLLLLLFVSSSCSTLMVWQITDIHVDDLYDPLGTPDTWCHVANASAEQQWFGQKGCGLPWHTVQSAVDFMQRTLPSPEVILWTGDTAPHWPYPDWTHVFPKLRRVTSMLRTAFPEAKILPAIGNHDAYPSDQFPFDNQTFYEEYLIESGWADLLGESERETFKKGGYYHTMVKNVKFIILNTNLYYQKNRIGGEPDLNSDPAGQISWLEDQLKPNNQPVVIAAHISPGFPHWNIFKTNLKNSYNYNLLKVMTRNGYESRLANLFGHEHIDTFQNVYRQDITFEQHTSSINSFLMAPSLIPGTKEQRTNPAVRLYTFLADRLNDYVQFHFDIKKANEDRRSGGEVEALDYWKITYRIRDVFGLPDVGRTSMHLLFKMIKEDDSMWDKYWRFTSGGYEDVPCNSTCKAHRLCIMSNQLYGPMAKCYEGSAAGVAASLGVISLTAVLLQVFN